MTSEDDTDDDAYLATEDQDDEEEEEAEATSAMVIVEEGRGVIVRGTDAPLYQLQAHPGAQYDILFYIMPPSDTGPLQAQPICY